MTLSYVALISVLLGVARSADVYLKSHCDFPVYLREVVSEYENPYDEGEVMYGHEIPTRGSWTSHFEWPYRGVSIKLAKTPWEKYVEPPPHTQVEYTFEPDSYDQGPRLYYDLSEIDCYHEDDGMARSDDCPFYYEGISIRSRDDCPEFMCTPQEPECPEAYNHPEDDWATTACVGDDAKLFVDLCLNTANGEAAYDAPDAPGTDTAGTQVFAQGQRAGGAQLKHVRLGAAPVHTGYRRSLSEVDDSIAAQRRRKFEMPSQRELDQVPHPPSDSRS